MSIPLIIMEEHHEAFFIWHYGYFNGFIQPFGNTLLHVDSHSDMSSGRLRSSIGHLVDDLKEIYDFVYRELGIATFIVPAIHKGIIGNYTFMRRYNGYTGEKNNCYVASYRNEGKLFQNGMAGPALRAELESGSCEWGGHQFYTFQTIGIAGQFATGQPLILDIDLDYFSCDNSLSSACSKIEITAQAYHEFVCDKYHPFRIFPSAEFMAVSEDGRYYLVRLEDQDEKDRDKVSFEVIDSRIERFLEFLKDNSLKPGLIDICRSRYSGYAPADQWAYIEDKLLKGLGGLYELNISHMDDFEKIYGCTPANADA